MPNKPLIRSGSISEVVAISQQVPELIDPYAEAVYRERLSDKPHLILVAELDGQLVGFKVGYEREADGSLYSWMGGVLPAARRSGVARALAQAQENWAREAGYHSIRFKTLNRHKAMLAFALDEGFYLLRVEPRVDPMESRIWLEKAIVQIK